MIFSLNILIHNILLVLSVSNKKAPKASTRCWILGGILVTSLMEKKYFLFFYISVTKIECFFYYALIFFCQKYICYTKLKLKVVMKMFQKYGAFHKNMTLF